MIGNFLSIPLFHVGISPIKENLAQIIKKDFFQPVSTFSDDLNRIQQLQDLLASKSTSETLDLVQYQKVIAAFYCMIRDVSRRFPDDVTSFEWFSTLRYQPVSRLVTSWKEEQAYLVYQLGALYCTKAHEENIFHEEGVKKACLFFKQSAGCFEYLISMLQEGATGKQPLDFDLHTVATLKLIMLAQAQEVIWLKAVSNPSMKNTLIARLSKKVAEYYEEAFEQAQKSNTIILDWKNHMRMKMHHFLAATYYRMSIVALDNFEYGKQVAYLKAASELCSEALKHKRYVVSEVIEDLRGLTDTVESILKTAEKENDLVFLKPVPMFQDLPRIDAVSMVLPEVPTELDTTDHNSAFASLVPFTIIQIAQAFKEREESYIQQVLTEPLLALGRMLRQFLAERDLPATIDTIQKPENVPESILSHLAEIKSLGGISILSDSMAEISELAIKSKNLIFECEERLRMENYEDELLRKRAGDINWNRAPSLTVTTNLTAKIEKMQSYLDQGHQSDLLIGDAFENIRPALVVYCGGKDALQKKIPSSVYVKLNPEMGKLVNDLKELLSEANKLEITRQRFIHGVDGKVRNHSILPLVLSEYRKRPSYFQESNGVVDPAKFEVIYEKQLQLYTEDLSFVESLKQKQTQLEGQIEETNLRFARCKEILNNAAQQERLKALQYFEHAYVQYLELIANLNRASSFYSDFLEKGNGVLRELDDFLYSRRDEARRLSIELQNQQKFNQIEHSMSLSLATPQSVRPNPLNRLSDDSQ